MRNLTAKRTYIKYNITDFKTLFDFIRNIHVILTLQAVCREFSCRLWRSNADHHNQS